MGNSEGKAGGPWLLLIGDDRSWLGRAAEILQSHFGSGCVHVHDQPEAPSAEVLDSIDLVLCAGATPSVESWLAELLQRAGRDAGLVAVTSRADPAWASRAIERGAIDCVVTDGSLESILPVAVARNLVRIEARRSERRLRSELRATIAQLKARSSALEQSVAHLECLVLTDPLTRLANRRQIEQRLPQMFAESVRYGSELACMMIDLDGFKAINDTLGHARGDDLLRITGHVIQEHVRAADIAARYGGDEFVILMPQTGSPIAAQVAERLMSVFHRHAAMSLRGGVRCGMSIGVSCTAISSPLDGPDLIAHADNALYAAKQAGKNKIMLCAADGVNAVVLAA